MLTDGWSCGAVSFGAVINFFFNTTSLKRKQLHPTHMKNVGGFRLVHQILKYYYYYYYYYGNKG